VAAWSELAFERSPVPSAIVARDEGGARRVTHASASLGRLLGHEPASLVGSAPEALGLTWREAELDEDTWLLQLVDEEAELRGAGRTRRPPTSSTTARCWRRRRR
jgi:hypothetical protein